MTKIMGKNLIDEYREVYNKRLSLGARIEVILIHLIWIRKRKIKIKFKKLGSLCKKGSFRCM